jgi:hypothetical protein
MPGKHGGDQGGRPRGRKNKKTLTKEAEREALRVLLSRQMTPVAEALISRCKGIRHFVTRYKTGKYEIVTDPARVLAALNKEDDFTGEFYTEKPDTPAIKEFFDRTVDKSTDQIEAKVTVTDARADRVIKARDRADGKR